MTEAKTNEELTEILFSGKTLKAKPLAKGVVQRATRSGATSCFVKCKVTGEWKYCSNERLEKLVAVKGSVDAVGREYISRDGLKQIKADAEKAQVEAQAVEA